MKVALPRRWSFVLGLGCFIILVLHLAVKNTTFKEKETVNIVISKRQMITKTGPQISRGYRNEKHDQVADQSMVPLLPRTKSQNIVFFNMPSWMSLDYTVLNSTRCPKLRQECKVHTKNTHFESSKGVIFYGEELPGKVPQKKPGQAWLFFSIESPFLYSVSPQWKDKFSWTVTFRRDSDFNYFYGKIHKRDVPLTRNYSELFKKKKKNVSWAVSNCKSFSKREDYVKKLQMHIDVDIYGRCGKLRCGARSAGITDCHKKFAEEYKFYLAVENSICKDYTTEKLYNFFFYDLPMIPIIYGPPNVHEYVPKGTYINILDYSSPLELAKDLQRIGSNETIYSQYLKEKDKYTAERFKWENVLCPLCVKLHEPENTKVIPDINSWIWNDTCIKP